MLVACRSGRVLEIPCHHAVFVPVGDYQGGDRVDPATVEVEARPPHGGIGRGSMIVVDNVVEEVESVVPRGGRQRE